MSELELVDLVREALTTVVVLSLPVLIVGLVVGLATGVLQTVTQVHDHALSFVPKLVAVLLLFSAGLPWFMRQLSTFAVAMFTGP